MISLPMLPEHAERTHPVSMFREHTLSSSISPLPCRRGRWGEQCGYIHIYTYILYIGVDGGVNNAEICVSIPGKGVKGPCFDDLGLPLTASKIKANILQSTLYSDFA
jgi:hypothetical protein